MNQPRFIGLLSCTAMLFFLVSCGGSNGDTATTNADSTVPAEPATKTSEAAPAANTIITTPESMMIVTHKVANFAKFMAVYDAHDSLRLANGVHSYVISRGLMDSNTVMVALKVDDVDKAKAFGKSADLKKAMQKSGVAGAPSISFITTTWQDTVTMDTKLRSRTTFAVKDWDAWLKSFQEGKQERIDNGITDRVIGHAVDDNKKVSLVTAVTDTAKAFAYYTSDALKKRRAAGGVIGEPARFLFQVVRRY